MADRSTQQAFLDACFGDEGSARAALEATPRMWLYRRLVRHNVVDVTTRMMPRARARMNDAAAGAFDAAIDAFMGERGPRTHHLRDVPMEFLDFARRRWSTDPGVPGYLVDLARYELVEFALGVSHAQPHAVPVGEVVVDRALVFAEVKELVTLGHAVHRLPGSVDDRTLPEAIPTWLLCYRDAAHQVRFLELTPLAARILAHLFEGDTLAVALRASSDEAGTPLSDEILGGTAALLADLADRGVFLGSRA